MSTIKNVESPHGRIHLQSHCYNVKLLMNSLLILCFVFTHKRSQNLLSVLTVKLYKLQVGGKQNTVND